MLTLTQSLWARGKAGTPLPTVWKSLEESGTRFMQGQLTLVAAGPGTGKSAFVLNYALKSKVSCVYFSADSDAFVQLTRSLAVLGGLSMEDAGKITLEGDEKRVGEIIGNSPIRFSYESSPTLAHIEKVLSAYYEMYGDYPELIVVDNALDVETGTLEEQSQSLDSLMGWLHEVARETQACVVVLHHVTGEYNNASKPIPLSGVKGQIGRVPEMILTLHKEASLGNGDAHYLNVSTVKNRGNRADPSGETYSQLYFDGSKMSITDEGTGGFTQW